MNLKNDVCDDKYFSLFAIKAEAEKIYNLALELEIDNSTKEEWRQYVVLCNFLIEQLKHKSHHDAIRDLKLVFGGARGLNPENEKLAKKILKASNANTTSAAPPSWNPQQQMMPQMMGPSMGHPQQHFGFGQPPMSQGGGFQGGCFTCGQFGHMAKTVLLQEDHLQIFREDAEAMVVEDLLGGDSITEERKEEEEIDLFCLSLSKFELNKLIIDCENF